MYKFFYFCIAISLIGCNRPEYPVPENNIKTNNGFEVAKLFNHDGCDVYRFYDNGAGDGGHPKYFIKCSTKKQVVETHVENCGKGCTRNVQTITVQGD